MMLAQVLASLFLLFAMSRAYARFRSGEMGLWGLFFWTVLWTGALVLIYWPNLFARVASILGIGRIVDIFVYGGIMMLFYLIFRAHILLEDMRHEITTLTRNLAIKDFEEENCE